MSVAQLHTGGRVVDAVSSARSHVQAAAALPVGSLGVDELADGIAGLAALEAQTAALRLALLAEADVRAVARSLGATGTDAWAARLTGANRAEMANVVRLARRLEETYDATREAFAAGAINQAQATVIVRAADLLPAEVTDTQRRTAEAGLVAKAAAGMDPRRLRQAGRRMLEAVARELADAHESTVLAHEERRAELETWLTLGDNGDGTFSGRFVIPELHGHLLRAALEALTSPAQLSRNKAGDVVRDDAVAELPGRNGSEKLGHGFLELIEHLPTSADGVAGGFTRNALTLLVHLDHEHLLDGLASARLDTGTRCRRVRPAGCPATPGSCRSCSVARRRCSTSAANAVSTRPRSAAPCPSPTTRVPPRAANAPSPGATSTTRTRGATAVPPTSTTACRSAGSTTAVPTTPVRPHPPPHRRGPLPPTAVGAAPDERGPARPPGLTGQERTNRCTHAGATRNASARSAATLTRGRSADERKHTKRGTHSGWYFAFAR